MSADLFTAAAERTALTSGRAYSQELAEIRCGALATPLPRALFETCEHGAAIEAECYECEPILAFDGAPDSKPCLECGRPCVAGCGLCSMYCAIRRFGD